MKKIIILTLTVVMSLAMFTGCVKPYDKPEFVTIEPHQTAFLIPLVGDTSAQASFESEEMLMQAETFSRMDSFEPIEMLHKAESWEISNSNSLMKKYLKEKSIVIKI